MSSPSLTKAQISCIDTDSVIYQCDQCGTVWSPDIQSGGRMPKGWWRCPNDCNEDAAG